uniref:Uncharacterized protein n=1 Tax=Mus musculus TaxID=10090 RepID=Q8C2B7_MOUSE|nr:unnamed protein product [Mus musculus]
MVGICLRHSSQVQPEECALSPLQPVSTEVLSPGSIMERRGGAQGPSGCLRLVTAAPQVLGLTRKGACEQKSWHAQLSGPSVPTRPVPWLRGVLSGRFLVGSS